jgi:hypothetical protein
MGGGGGGQKVRVERQDHLGARELEPRFDHPTEREPGPEPRRATGHRGVEVHDDVPAGAQALHEVHEVRSARGRQEHVRPLARRRRRGNGGSEGGPWNREPTVGDRAGSVGIVEIEQARLLQRAQSAGARRVVRVALQLRGASLVALGEHADAVAVQARHRRVPGRHRGRDLRRLLHIRNDELLRTAAARARACGRCARPHELQHDPPGHRRAHAVSHLGYLVYLVYLWQPVQLTGGST